MDRNDLTTQQQRQLKFAEAGVLFVLVMALTVFLGVKLTADDAELTARHERTTTVAAEPVAKVPVARVPVAGADAAVGGDAESAHDAIAGAAAPEPPEPAILEPAAPPAVTYAEAEAAYRARRWEEAAALFTAYTEDHPNNAWGYYMLGLSQRRAGEPAAAQASLLTALDIAPNHVKSKVNLARVQLDLGEAAAAVATLQTALAAEPGNVQAHRVLGRAYRELGRTDDAIAAYHAALRLDIDDAWALNNLGLLYIETERFADAIAPLARACQIDSSVACFANNLGVALERGGHPGAAIEAFAAALNADADYAKAAAALARLTACGAADEPITIDLEALAAGFRFEKTAEAFAAAEAATARDPRTAADALRADGERP